MSLADAPVVLCAGGGLLGASPRAVCTALTEIAGVLGASIGATRAIVDAGWFDSSRLVGASGVSIDPVLYLGFGVSGAAYHEIGRPVHVLSVNTDPGAPLSRRADLALCTDAAALLGELGRRADGLSAPGRPLTPRQDVGPPGGSVLVAPSGGPHERLRTLIGAVSGPARPVAPVGAAEAADALLGFLAGHGYLEMRGGPGGVLMS